ncbi:pyridoxamine 5'-phosphate oxidase family protein [Celeribacter sp.]|uniref:pyridoxamine 5'-phosphate oxidase family protein n=1 Tax=Celeribacter sp. TaxID=1890673 RepID=UPI003A8D3D9A
MTQPKGKGSAASAIAPDTPQGHPGELEMRQRFPSDYHWNDHSLTAMMRPILSTGLARFIESLPFFFIATSDAEGHCDCSFRGREHDDTGAPLPALRVIDTGSLVFPDFSGNGLYNSLGNIQVNPHIGMLFMDFDRRRRARVNGIAQIIEASEDIRSTWPTAQAAILVSVEQAYGNCQARIPRMTPT